MCVCNCVQHPNVLRTHFIYVVSFYLLCVSVFFSFLSFPLFWVVSRQPFRLFAWNMEHLNFTLNSFNFLKLQNSFDSTLCTNVKFRKLFINFSKSFFLSELFNVFVNLYISISFFANRHSPEIKCRYNVIIWRHVKIIWEKNCFFFSWRMRNVLNLLIHFIMYFRRVGVLMLIFLVFFRCLLSIPFIWAVKVSVMLCSKRSKSVHHRRTQLIFFLTS